MGKIYAKADQETYTLVKQVIQEFYPQLAELNVNAAVTIVSKIAGEDDELVPCLKLHGCFCAAVIRLVSMSAKVHVPHDVEILIDLYGWMEYSPAKKKAVIDHELNHISICLDKVGAPIKDDNGRPKLKLKPDDINITGFYAIIQRHGENSVEYCNIKQVFDKVSSIMSFRALPQAVPESSPAPDGQSPEALLELTEIEA